MIGMGRNRNNIKDNNFDNKVDKQEAGKRMPVWKLVITDIFLTLICLGIFSLYHLVIPRHLSSNAVVVTTVQDGEDTTFELPDSDQIKEANFGIDIESSDIKEAENDKEEITGSEEKTGSEEITGSDEISNDVIQTEEPVEITNFGNSDTLEILGDATEQDYISSADKKITEMNSYKSDNIQFVTNRVEIGTGVDKITYYISDVYVTNVKYLKTAFAKGEYGKNLKEDTLEMATDNHALLAINGDFYGNSEIGVVIRNGILYRTEVYDADICVLFTDGTLKTYSPEEFNVDQVLEEGAWQAWIFGPELLDGKGKVLSTFNSTYYLSKEHPRTAIGYVEPGHYVFIVADGRDLGYSRGVTLSELGQIMADAGCVSAYNLDGGKSSAMAYGEAYVNQPFEGGRTISDIIYIGE